MCQLNVADSECELSEFGVLAFLFERIAINRKDVLRDHVDRVELAHLANFDCVVGLAQEIDIPDEIVGGRFEVRQKTFKLATETRRKLLTIGQFGLLVLACGQSAKIRKSGYLEGLRIAEGLLDVLRYASVEHSRAAYVGSENLEIL